MIAKMLRATHQGELRIANVKIGCFVLEDGRRLISQRALRKSLGMSSSGGNLGAQRVLDIVTKIAEKGVNPEDLLAQISSPIVFKTPTGGFTVFGHEASLLTDLCEFFLQARDRGKLTSQQKRYAVESEMLMRALAKVGIIALIDEATGYQEVRDRLALQEILDKYLLKEYAKWARRFPPEFYQEMFRLKGWKLNGLKRPSVVGTYTNDIVYSRLAPGVLDELKRRNPPDEKGNRKARHHQYLTLDIGHPALERHLDIVMALMRAAPTWGNFSRMLQRAIPKPGDQVEFEGQGFERADEKQ